MPFERLVRENEEDHVATQRGEDLILWLLRLSQLDGLTYGHIQSKYPAVWWARSLIPQPYSMHIMYVTFDR